MRTKKRPKLTREEPSNHNIFTLLYFFSCLLLVPSLAYADDPQEKIPSMSRDEKVVITTEHLGSQEKPQEVIDTYKTTIIRELKVSAGRYENISSGEEIKLKNPYILRSLIFQEFETTIVTAKRAPSERTQIAENVRVYSQEDIAKLPGRDLGEILAYLPGVDIEPRNKFGQVASLSINGSNATETLLFVDGILFNTELSGRANPTVIPVELIQRITVIQGASSSTYGSSLGGVVQVETRDLGTDKKPKGSFRSTFAEFATTQNSLDLAGKIGKLGYYLFGSFMSTDGIRSESNVEESQYFGKLAFPLSEQVKIESSLGYTGADVRDGVKPDGTTTAQPHYTHYGQLSLQVDQPRFHLNIAGKYNIQDLKSETIGDPAINSKSNYQGLSVLMSRAFRDQDLLVVGADFDFNTIKSSTNIDQPKTNSVQAPYLNYTFHWDQWDVIPGLRYDHHNRFDGQFSPSLGVVYRLKDAQNTRVRAKVSQAFNAPHLLLIHAESLPLVVSNVELQPEKAVVYEIGMTTHMTSKFTIDLNGYWAEIKDAIQVVDIGTFEFQPQNFKRFRRQSVNISLDYQVLKHLSVFAYGAFHHVVDQDTDQIVRGTGIPRQNIRLGVNYANEQGLGFNLYASYDRSNNHASVEPNDRKFMVDAKITYQLIKSKKESQDHEHPSDGTGLELFLNIYNITNSSYWANKNFPLPRRYFEGGFLIKF